MIELDSLVQLALDHSKRRITIADMVHALGDGSLKMLILFFALPNSVPTLPGTSTILCLPLLFLTMQMALCQSPWMPAWLARQSLSRKDFATLVLRLKTLSTRIDRICIPRLGRYVGCGAIRVAGFLGILLSAVLVLPLPLVNVPCGIALVLLSLGNLYKDGLFSILGFITGFASLGLAAGVVIFSWRIGHQILLSWRF
ncbi:MULTISPECIES: exopolysaccharide biosynthesis protein [Polaromonas]|uniref:Exopolysaccharide biosynthesis protein n=1 Tax=Polaromonas aquatica TaxID=332657 RepID=A0ABW1TUS0_9BURK